MKKCRIFIKFGIDEETPETSGASCVPHKSFCCVENMVFHWWAMIEWEIIPPLNGFPAAQGYAGPEHERLGTQKFRKNENILK